MKFFNSSKKWRFASSSITKYILAALLSLVGVQGVLAQSFYVAGNGDSDNRGSWCDGESWSPSSSLMTQQGNIYVKQFASLPANDDYQFKIVKDKNWNNGSWGFSNYQSSSDNTNFISGSVSCSDAGDNIKFSLSQTANVTVVFDFTNNRVAVYSSSVEIGLIGSFINNWNLEQQIMGTTGDGVSYTWDLSSSDISLDDSDEFKFISGTSRDNNNNQWGGPLGGAYTIPPSASTDGTIYNVDIVHHKDCGNVKFDAPLCPVTIQKIELNVLTNDLKITTGESSTEPDPVTPTADSYVVEWAEPVYDSEAGSLMLQAAIAASETAGFTLDQASGLQAQINVQGGASSGRVSLPDGEGQYVVSHTVTGVQAGSTVNYSLQIVTGGGSEIVLPSDVQNINPQAYVVEETSVDPDVNLYLIGSGTTAHWNIADALPFDFSDGVYKWTGELSVHDEAFKILTSNEKWEPAYVASSPAQEIALDVPIALNYRESTSSSVEDNKFKISEGGEYTIKVTLGADNSGSMIVTKKSDPAYSATITADASAEQVSLASTLTETAAGTDLATATCVFQYKAADAGDETYADMSETASVIYSGEGATRTATLSQSMAAGSYVFRAVWTYNSAEVANAVTETVTVQNNCQNLVDGFTISGQFNVGVSDGGGLYEGSPVVSGEEDPAEGYWSDGARFIQLTADDVPANYFKWECTTYAIDGVNETIPDIAWTGQDKTSARAELSLPGTYTFVCKARCNETDDWTISKELTITAPAPEMGFNGNIVTNHDWGTPSWAGQRDGGYMQRVEGSLVWKSNGFTVDGFGDNQAYHFVVEQRYKLLGCVTNEGWTEDGECGGSGKDNKINRSKLTFTNVAFNAETHGHNFIAINNSGWTSGVDGTKLQLVVTMNGYDSYKVELVEYKEECQNIQTGFGISAQLNAGETYPWVGNVVESENNIATGGYFADDHRTVTLSTSQVADNYEWVCVQYAIDGTPQTVDIADVVTISNPGQQSATATLNLPGDYTFQCRAKCAADANYTESAPVTISVYPAMGMDGPILDGSWPSHSIAGQSDHQLTRVKGSLVWSKSFNCSDNGGTTDNYQFVVIQQYKNGCEANTGWAGYEECGPDGAKYNNKINDSNIKFVSNSVKCVGGNNSNFMPVVTPSDGALLTLTVTMTGYDSYEVVLSEYKNIFATATTEPADGSRGTVSMAAPDGTIIPSGSNVADYVGQQVTLTATPAKGYKVASWEINGKVTESDRTTINPTLSGEGLNVVVTFKRDCYAGVAYDLTGGGVICANDGSTELSLNTLNNVTYQLYRGGEPYGKAAPVQGNGEAAKWTISEAGTYTAKAYDSRHEECQEQAIDMNGSAVVTTVTAPKITVNPGDNVHLTVLQARSFTTADVPVDWSITAVTRDGIYCDGVGYMISSQTDTSLVAKFLCIGTAKITATMKEPNRNCMAEVTVHQNGAETEACAPEPEDMQ